MKNKLNYTELKRFFDCEIMPFQTTKEIQPDYKIKAQPRFEKAMDLGLSIKSDGFNIYVLGDESLGKKTLTKELVINKAKGEVGCYDYCMVNNFDNEDSPIILKFASGSGKAFKEDMDNLVKELKNDVDVYSVIPTIEYKKDKILMEYQQYKDKETLKLSSEMRKFDFGVKSTKQGIFLMPIVDGEILSDEEIEKLSEEDKADINKRSALIYDDIQKVITELNIKENKAYDTIAKYEEAEVIMFVGEIFSDISYKYNVNKDISDYLKIIKNDLVKQICDLVRNKENSKFDIEFLKKYEVNLLVDNSEVEGVPVVFANDCTVQSLIGSIEFNNEFGFYTTDFMKYSAGLLHKANGGYLVLNAYDLFSNKYSYDVIKRVLDEKQLDFDLLVEFTGLTKKTLNTQPIDINIKVIIIGGYYYYDVLSSYDEGFNKLFKVVAEFNDVMIYNDDNIREFIGLIKKFIIDEKVKDITNKGMAKLIEYSTKITENQNKLTTKFSLIKDILIEANYYAKGEFITDEDIEKVFFEKRYRANLHEEDLDELIDDNIIMIDTTNEIVGQINALSVLDMGEYAFGKPSRITATTYNGENGILNIEKEVELSGKIHDKGVNIIDGYLGQTYAQDFPLSLSCNICFEQNYGGVDGDSASSTELYTILSSLSEVPIKQWIAVTGSVNQRGEIQAVGGVTYKIEGFYDLCKKRGLTGKEGVIIPRQNIQDLVLKDDLIEDVKEGLFNIYAISHINEGIEILTGVKAGNKGIDDKFEQDTINYKVYEKLKKFSEIANDNEE